MSESEIPAFLWGNRRLEGTWRQGMYLLGDSGGATPGDAIAWTVSNEAFLEGQNTESLYFGPSGSSGIDTLALRRAVFEPGTRIGIRSVFGVCPRHEQGIDARKALMARDALRRSDEAIQQVSRRRQDLGGPVVMRPVAWGEIAAKLLTARPPEFSACDPHGLAALVALLLTKWDGNHRQALVLGDSETRISTYYRAAFELLPTALVSSLRFSTLEGTPMGGLDLVGVVPQFWHFEKAYTQLDWDALDLRPSSGPAYPATRWDACAAWIVKCALSGCDLSEVRAAVSLDELGSLQDRTERLRANPDSLTDSEILQLAAKGSPAIKRITPDRLARCVLGVASSGREVPTALLKDRTTADLVAEQIDRYLPQLSDPNLASLIQVLGDERIIKHNMPYVVRKPMVRAMIHPGCQSGDSCPLVLLVDRVLEQDPYWQNLASAENPEILPQRIRVELKLAQYLSGDVDLERKHLRSLSPEKVVAVVTTLMRTDTPATGGAEFVPGEVNRSLLAHRLAALPDQTRLEVARKLLARPETFDFAAAFLLPLLRTQSHGRVAIPEAQLRACLFDRSSHAYERWNIPSEAQVYLTHAEGGTPLRPRQELNLELLRKLWASGDVAGYNELAWAVRQSDQDTADMALARLPGEEVQYYLPRTARAPIELRWDVIDRLLRSPEGDQFLLATLLPAVDPSHARNIFAGHLDQLRKFHPLPLETVDACFAAAQSIAATPIVIASPTRGYPWPPIRHPAEPIADITMRKARFECPKRRASGHTRGGSAALGAVLLCLVVFLGIWVMRRGPEDPSGPGPQTSGSTTGENAPPDKATEPATQGGPAGPPAMLLPFHP